MTDRLQNIYMIVEMNSICMGCGAARPSRQTGRPDMLPQIHFGTVLPLHCNNCDPRYNDYKNAHPELFAIRGKGKGSRGQGSGKR